MRGAERTMWRGREQPACSSVTHRLALSLLIGLRMHGTGRWTALTGTFENIRLIWDDIKAEPPHHCGCDTDASGGHPTERKEPPRLCGTDKIYRLGCEIPQGFSVNLAIFNLDYITHHCTVQCTTAKLHNGYTEDTLTPKARCFQASSCAAFLDVT